MPNQKNIVLFDPKELGHHDTYINIISKIMIDIGYKVHIIYSNQTTTKKHLYDLGEKYQSNATFSDFKPRQIKFSPKSPYLYVPFRIIQRLIYWGQLNTKIKRIEKKHKLKIDHVFTLWLDTMLCHFFHPIFLDTWFKKSWSGIFFHPWYLKEVITQTPSIRDLDILLTSKKCKSIFLLKTNQVEPLEKRLNKTVPALPDFGEFNLPQTEDPIAKNIKTLKKGRTVIGLIGILSTEKDLMGLIELAKKMDQSSFVFVFAGLLKIDQFLENEQSIILEFFEQERENCIAYTQHLDELSFNSIFSAIDINYLIYIDFDSSSNRLTKAAFFKKLSLSNNDTYIGNKVKEYRLGEVITENTLEEKINKLMVLKELNNNKYLFEDNFKKYLDKNNEKRLKEILTNTF